MSLTLIFPFQLIMNITILLSKFRDVKQIFFDILLNLHIEAFTIIRLIILSHIVAQTVRAISLPVCKIILELTPVICFFQQTLSPISRGLARKDIRQYPHT